MNRIEETLPKFNQGIEIATRIGNDQLIIEAYKKNVMIASTNGFYDVANYFYEKCYEIVTKNVIFLKKPVFIMEWDIIVVQLSNIRKRMNILTKHF